MGEKPELVYHAGTQSPAPLHLLPQVTQRWLGAGEGGSKGCDPAAMFCVQVGGADMGVSYLTLYSLKSVVFLSPVLSQ